MPGAGDSRQRQWGGFGVRPGRHGRPAAGATGTTGDSRHGAATAATGLYGVSRVLSFLGEAAGGSLPVLPELAPAPVGSRLEGGARETAGGGTPPRHSQATRAANSRTAQDGEARRRKLPLASRQHRNKQETPPLAAKAPDETARQAVRGARHQPSGPRQEGCRGDGRQPRREHRHLQ